MVRNLAIKSELKIPLPYQNAEVYAGITIAKYVDIYHVIRSRSSIS